MNIKENGKISENYSKITNEKLKVLFGKTLFLEFRIRTILQENKIPIFCYKNKKIKSSENLMELLKKFSMENKIVKDMKEIYETVKDYRNAIVHADYYKIFTLLKKAKENNDFTPGEKFSNNEKQIEKAIEEEIKKAEAGKEWRKPRIKKFLLILSWPEVFEFLSEKFDTAIKEINKFEKCVFKKFM